VPLWAQGRKNKEDTEFRGAYCYDQFPSAEDKHFINKYFKNVDGLVDYLIFNEDREKIQQEGNGELLANIT